ncbi:MAG: hypothetical protein A3E02_01020 [Candidatus Zambryskibacteria bacterium RIFCSPHIGHO2_12_FULL_38_34]|uniref:SCP domain-containing protein n=1 Tax=Candidatus Zambryskibacteria bacterium RIFCSPLOWO2_12_FULL_39_16 TaxID=1802775 RepID=A0A1G2USF3_9BACT|nr:MAG: hypothetical protein A3D37_01875 [Candidatus Zambryskibacteria bacterium RIFCSPHIGHO2_02_FULL_38_22]OHA98042.1 MAG: hypothetical protein A3E02_01020 [Candidatus Zambryskibacteria bacterium RIFCSPHIGHO2_12_FULL_38_34]OHB07929.1 MAG: hypothetical protein A3I19_00300 [Candidatus Zambryskibacteria bacterium RIFCSPLOWO2_02_FULL_38_13]OHB12333.1 MAG: hypothetical protein A3G46_02005 [Candidatus Zambryskibacteria bacterium RIFCSPLOWO2_12_FULL_39_16]
MINFKKYTTMKYLKTFSVILFLIIVVSISVPSFRTGVLDSLSAIYGAILVNLTNQNRAAANIAELSVNPLLEKAAQMKADDMASKGYFAHNTPDGKTPWYWLGQAGYKYTYAGENLAVNFENSEDVENAWMNSPGHFLNIMNPKYTEIGIATSTGIYKGRQAVFVVQMFGSPLN